VTYFSNPRRALQWMAHFRNALDDDDDDDNDDDDDDDDAECSASSFFAKHNALSNARSIVLAINDLPC
jgi:hypothetical protein